jgi:hypothetical protein
MATANIGVPMQAQQVIVISAICNSQLYFQQMNNYQLLYLTSTIYFQLQAVIGRRNTNSQPAYNLLQLITQK